MAFRGQNTRVIEFAAGGVRLTPDAADKGFYVQNMEFEQSSLKTRNGFGVVAEISPSLTTGNKSAFRQDIGLDKIVGSKIIRTDYGHDQLVVIGTGRFYTATSLQTDALNNEYRSLFVIAVYDFETNEYLIEPIARHPTVASPLDTWEMHGTWEQDARTNYSRKDQNWIPAPRKDPAPVSMSLNPDNRLLITSEDLGPHVYTPSIFLAGAIGTYQNESRRKHAVESYFQQDWKRKYSDSPIMRPIIPGPGLFSEGFTYLERGDLGNPQAVAALGTRTLWANGDLIYISDADNPAGIVAENVIQIPGMDQAIVAMAVSYGRLIVWTEDSTTVVDFPASSSDGVISGARITSVSDSVGIAGAHAWTSIDSTVTWMHETGIYGLSGNYQISKLSQPIDPYFEEGISNPLSNYYVDNGGTAMADPQPRTYFKFDRNGTPPHASYDPVLRRAFWSIPDQGIAFVLDDAGFILWNFETIANDESPAEVKATKNLPSMRIDVDADGQVYGTAIWTDNFADTSVALPYQSSVTSLVVTQLGRGGGLDRSSANFEDQRIFSGEETRSEILQVTAGIDTRDLGWFVVRPPMHLPDGRPLAQSGTTVDGEAAPIWVPIELVPKYANITVQTDSGSALFEQVKEFYFQFSFNNTDWSPFFSTTATNPYEIAFDLPEERLAAKAAYYYDSAVAAPTNVGVYCYDTGTGAGSTTGDGIAIRVDGSAAGAGDWGNIPFFGFSPRNRNPIIYLPFYRKQATITDNTIDLGITPILAQMVTEDNVTIETTTNLGAIVWHESTKGALVGVEHSGDALAQAVDWAVHVPNQSTPEDGMLKLRGVDIEVESSGEADPVEVAPLWPTGLYNVAHSSNYRLWAAQEISHAANPNNLPGIALAAKKGTVRQRAGTSAATAAPLYNNGMTMGDGTNSATGNILAADPAYDSIRTSAGIKGESVSSTLFGHVRDKAEKLRIGAIKMVVRVLGGSARRRGR